MSEKVKVKIALKKKKPAELTSIHNKYEIMCLLVLSQTTRMQKLFEK